MMNRQFGFSLVELMIVLAIVGVISAIAIPLFSSNVSTARLQCVRADLTEYRGELERNYASNGFQYTPPIVDMADYDDCDYTYTTTYFDAGVQVTFNAAGVASPAGARPQSYILTAVPDTGGSMAGEGAFTLTSAGIMCFRAGNDTPLATTAAHVNDSSSAVCPKQL